jgi:hypothetical protein
MRSSYYKKLNDKVIEIDESGGTSPYIKDRIIYWSKNNPVKAAIVILLLSATALIIISLLNVIYLLLTGAGGSMGH